MLYSLLLIYIYIHVQVLETNINHILTSITEQNKLHEASMKSVSNLDMGRGTSTTTAITSATQSASNFGGMLFTSITDRLRS